MAGLQSQNISLASIRQSGSSSIDKNTCVFCRRRSSPPASDPHAPVFAFFSLVDCRHYACQPCALVNCDNAGRFIECPQCHCISRLAQSGRKRASSSSGAAAGGTAGGRIAIDDGVSSVGSRATAFSRGSAPARSAMKRSSSNGSQRKKRSSSVQFPVNPIVETDSAVVMAGGGEREPSPLTHDAVAALPVDPAHARREKQREKEMVAAQALEPPAVSLYALPSTATQQPKRKSKDRTRSEPAPLRPESERIMTKVDAQPKIPAKSLVLHTIEEDEAAAAVDEANENTQRENDLEERIACISTEEADRAAIEAAEQHRFHRITEDRDDGLSALRTSRTLEAEFSISPTTPVVNPLDISQVSATSDEVSQQSSVVSKTSSRLRHKSSKSHFQQQQQQQPPQQRSGEAQSSPAAEPLVGIYSANGESSETSAQAPPTLLSQETPTDQATDTKPADTAADGGTHAHAATDKAPDQQTGAASQPSHEHPSTTTEPTATTSAPAGQHPENEQLELEGPSANLTANIQSLDISESVDREAIEEAQKSLHKDAMAALEAYTQLAAEQKEAARLVQLQAQQQEEQEGSHASHAADAAGLVKTGAYPRGEQKEQELEKERHARRAAREVENFQHDTEASERQRVHLEQERARVALAADITAAIQAHAQLLEEQKEQELGKERQARCAAREVDSVQYDEEPPARQRVHLEQERARVALAADITAAIQAHAQLLEEQKEQELGKERQARRAAREVENFQHDMEASERQRIEREQERVRASLATEAAAAAQLRLVTKAAQAAREQALAQEQLRVKKEQELHQALAEQEDYLCEEEDDRFAIKEEEREQRRVLRVKAARAASARALSNSEMLDSTATVTGGGGTEGFTSIMSEATTVGPVGARNAHDRGSFLDASAQQAPSDGSVRNGTPISGPTQREVELLQQLREQERARGEEILNANERLLEAERRLAAEAHTRELAEAARVAALAEAERLLAEAEQRGEERIRRVREAAQQELEECIDAIRSEAERRAAHEAALRALEEEERAAMLEAKLQAAERNLEDAQRRAALEISKAREEAQIQAAIEAARVGRQAREREAEFAEREHAANMLRLAERTKEREEAEERLRAIEQRATETIREATEEAQKAAAGAQARLEELQKRQADRAAEVQRAQEQLFEAREQKREFESQREASQRGGSSFQTTPLLSRSSANSARIAQAVAMAATAGQQGSPTPLGALNMSGTSAGYLSNSNISGHHTPTYRVQVKHSDRGAPHTPEHPSTALSSVRRSQNVYNEDPHEHLAQSPSQPPTIYGDGATPNTLHSVSQRGSPQSHLRGSMMPPPQQPVSASVTPLRSPLSHQQQQQQPARSEQGDMDAGPIASTQFHLLTERLVRAAIQEAVQEILRAQEDVRAMREQAEEQASEGERRYLARRQDRDRAERDLLEAESSLDDGDNATEESSRGDQRETQHHRQRDAHDETAGSHSFYSDDAAWEESVQSTPYFDTPFRTRGAPPGRGTGISAAVAPPQHHRYQHQQQQQQDQRRQVLQSEHRRSLSGMHPKNYTRKDHPHHDSRHYPRAEAAAAHQYYYSPQDAAAAAGGGGAGEIAGETPPRRSQTRPDHHDAGNAYEHEDKDEREAPQQQQMERESQRRSSCSVVDSMPHPNMMCTRCYRDDTTSACWSCGEVVCRLCGVRQGALRKLCCAAQQRELQKSFADLKRQQKLNVRDAETSPIVVVEAGVLNAPQLPPPHQQVSRRLLESVQSTPGRLSPAQQRPLRVETRSIAVEVPASVTAATQTSGARRHGRQPSTQEASSASLPTSPSARRASTLHASRNSMESKTESRSHHATQHTRHHGGEDDEDGVRFEVVVARSHDYEGRKREDSRSDDEVDEVAVDIEAVLDREAEAPISPERHAQSISSEPEEPKTVKKKFDAFFVPFGIDGEPRRAKPPTPCNYVPSKMFSTKSASSHPPMKKESNTRSASPRTGSGNFTFTVKPMPPSAAAKRDRNWGREFMQQVTGGAARRPPPPPSQARRHYPNSGTETRNRSQLRRRPSVPRNGWDEARKPTRDRRPGRPVSPYGRGASGEKVANPYLAYSSTDNMSAYQPQYEMSDIQYGDAHASGSAALHPRGTSTWGVTDPREFHYPRTVEELLGETHYAGRPLVPPEVARAAAQQQRRYRQQPFSSVIPRPWDTDELHKETTNLRHMPANECRRHSSSFDSYSLLPSGEHMESRRQPGAVDGMAITPVLNRNARPPQEEQSEQPRTASKHFVDPTEATRCYSCGVRSGRAELGGRCSHCAARAASGGKHFDGVPEKQQQKQQQHVRTGQDVRRREAPTLEELDRRLRQLREQDHRDLLEDRHRSRENGATRHPSTRIFDPTVTVVFGGGGQRPQSRSRSGRTRQLHTVSPPWRTDLNTSPIKPPWNVTQPRSPLYRPSSRVCTGDY